ncbi:methionine synthase [Streptomyces sp. YIM 98790]|uniref:methionine synthase n=1 Tax=Streptomyces sp. YIM 98790 TaxID=2689077 RepID=UPI00140B016D|nr:methionine synthase [Streptomyces sp. YIM 98790]
MSAADGAADGGAFPWEPGTATGVGSMPGTDIRETVRVVTGAVEGLPFLPELPGRGPGADMTGRTAGLLAEMYVQREPSGWRIADRPGRDTRRAAAWLRQDLDTLEEFTQGFTGPLKLQAVGPWTLAAAVERRNGEAMLGDPGACRDLAASLAEGLRAHLAGLRRRIPGARPVLQLDEPSLPAVLRGRVRTASGYRTYPAVDRAVVRDTLRALLDAAGGPQVLPAVHCCAPGLPFGLLRESGFRAVSFDLSLLTEREYDAVAESVEAGVALFAGVLPGHGTAGPDGEGPLSDPAGTVSGVRTLWRRLGLSPESAARAVVVTPSCGLAGASPAYARAALEHCTRAARTLVDDPV